MVVVSLVKFRQGKAVRVRLVSLRLAKVWHDTAAMACIGSVGQLCHGWSSPVLLWNVRARQSWKVKAL